ncbi:MAG TPA: transglycosylase domain-containing protein [Trebonia sp.]|nr:transglycosylase domain-containing protein [Trebonia sp.]
MQLLDWTASKTSALGRLLLISGLGGVLAAAMVLPVVAATGILVRNTSDKFTTLSLNTSSLPQRSEIFDRQGHLITYVFGVDLGPGMTYTGIDRQPVAYSQISPNMTKAIVAIEDDRYWTHGAIDIKGTLRALVNDLRHQPVQGGSSIAQQYVKGVLVLQGLGNPAAEQAAIADNLNRKLNELRMAVDIEHTMSKQDILAGYLNDAYFGNGAWGVEAAAETYFGTTAAKLSLVQAATLAGIVENPSEYDPMVNPAMSLERRNTVLARMMQTKVLSPADEAAALKQKLVLHPGAVQNGCGADIAGDDAFFCDYVIHTILLDKTFGATTEDRARLLATGGLRIYTTLDAKDQSAATRAVNYVVPENSNYYNPGHNVDTEALIQPGTGKVLAIAEDQPYGTGKGQTEVDYAVNSQYGGSGGVQTGSSSKLFTLITALEQGVPFGFTETVPYSTTVTGYTDCAGQPAGYDPNAGAGAWQVVNASPGDKGTFSLYTGTTASINTFYAELEKKVGLCNVVHTAMKLGMTWADGTPLTDKDRTPLGTLPSADNTPSFTLGAVNVSPLSMAAAYATVASGGIYCKPVAISKVIDASGRSLPVPSAGCHRVLSSEVANAVNYILQGVLTFPGATAVNLGPIPGYQTAGKTGTSNVTNGFGTPYAAFAGYTTNLASFTSVFNPISPTVKYTMGGMRSCYRLESGGLDCPGEMYGANAPGSTWHMTFDHANLGRARAFGQVPADSELYSMGNGQNVAQNPPKKGGHGGGNGANGGNGGNGPGGGGNGGVGPGAGGVGPGAGGGPPGRGRG